MSRPGWYPNPDGGDEPAYWDGTQWTDGPPQRSGTIGWVVAGVLLILTVVVVLILQPSSLPIVGDSPSEDTRSDRPTVKPWDERSVSPSEPETEDDGGAAPAQCAEVGYPHSEVGPDGRLHGGGVSVVAPTAPGWIDSTTFMPWMSEQNSRVRSVADGWVASVDVGSVRAQDGFRAPKQAAHAMLSCMASSWMYQGYTGDEVLTSEAFSLDGNDGWHVKANVHVDRADGIKGDVLDIYVFDIGRDGELSVVVGCATIEHEPSITEVDQAVASMRVD